MTSSTVTRAPQISRRSHPPHATLPSNPDEAPEWQAERDELYPDGWDFPAYASGGETQIGTFRIGG